MKSLKYFEEIENYSEIGHCLNNIGAVYVEQGKINKALDYYNHVLGFKEKIEKISIYARVLNNIGVAYRYQSKLDKALGYYEHSLRIRKELGDIKYIATSLNNIAVQYCLRGHFKKAMHYHQQALHLYLKIGTLITIARSLNNIAEIYREQGQIEIAINFHNNSLKLRKQIGNQIECAYSLNNIGMCYYLQNQLNISLEYLQQAFEIIEKTGNSIDLAEIITNIAIILREQKTFNIKNSIIQKFPKPPFDSPIIESFYQIIQALSSEQNKNWGLAEKFWKKASKIKGQEFYFILLCYEALTDIAFRYWRYEPSDKNYKFLKQRLVEWMTLCQDNHLTPSLCKVYLLQAKIALIKFQFSSAEQLLNQCLLTAEEYGLPLHQQLAKQELDKLNSQKNIIKNQLGIQQTQFKNEHLQDFTAYLNHLPKKFLELN